MLANVRARRQAGEEHDNPFPGSKTIGWRPSCDCKEETTVPCIVLDPFIGSGTTAIVARRLGRDYIGIDLGYAEIQQRRIKQNEDRNYRLDFV